MSILLASILGADAVSTVPFHASELVLQNSPVSVPKFLFLPSRSCPKARVRFHGYYFQACLGHFV